MVIDRSGEGRQDCSGDGKPPAELRCLRVPAAAERLPALRHELTRWAVRTGLGPDDVEALALAAYEAMANVVEHAYSDGAGGLDLEAVYLPEENGVRVTVSDQGAWSPSASEPHRGRGLQLIRRLARKAEVVAGDDGTTVRMFWPVAE